MANRVLFPVKRREQSVRRRREREREKGQKVTSDDLMEATANTVDQLTIERGKKNTVHINLSTCPIYSTDDRFFLSHSLFFARSFRVSLPLFCPSAVGDVVRLDFISLALALSVTRSLAHSVSRCLAFCLAPGVCHLRGERVLIHHRTMQRGERGNTSEE